MHTVRRAALISAVLITTTILASTALMTRYETLSVRAHNPRIRQLVPLRVARRVGPCLPATALLGIPAADRLAGAPVPAAVAGWALWALFALIVAEAYAVCLRREAWIPEFQPWLVPTEATPLGGRPSKADDRRIQQQFRTLCTYSTVPILLTATLPLTASPAVLLPLAATIAKLFSFSSTQGEFETAVHWNMHCGVLGVEGRPRLTRAVVAGMNWIFGPVNGYIPHVYDTNHILIHHVENSGPKDIHSPLPYDRTSYLEFCYFAQRMIGSLLFATDLLFHPRCRKRGRAALVAGIAGFWLIDVALFATGRALAVWLLLAVLHRAVASARSQTIWHGLIDPAGPFDALTTAILWLPSREAWESLLAAPIDPGTRPRGRLPVETRAAVADVPAPGTDWAFFDNYHLVHHLHPRAHFSEFPELLRRYAPLVRSSECPVLALANIRHFARDCWSRNFAALGATVIAGPEGDVEHYLRRRLAPSAEFRSPVAPITEGRVCRSIDQFVGRAVRRR